MGKALCCGEMVIDKNFQLTKQKAIPNETKQSRNYRAGQQ